ncbi:3-deoxy-7-phosphoheptulonate synthase class II [Nanchangia anserum]|uniref:Phospho-2-dehydro-3-deoxyheptonate aldolase n=1 Tax=Nanchangia anserum TaxID=2692125 RepID=A0A8I0G9T6_9ACTO|nr:3-deoxy-7-phosphoheptulonate synthase class II [Nanchangia anserum]MBD3688843.1 3-deoxy-7-phosphoheptulonate synthase class II [Nanchangia anserum]QOX81116.1 3-deoxy-7-phosphoheptulonate synthase class II [Nanchangia anserum]
MRPENAHALSTWRDCPVSQQPAYPDAEAVADVVADLRDRPPLVFAGEVDQLRTKLAEASRGDAFVLTGGDCAETFAESTAVRLRLKIQAILQMAIVLTYGSSMPVIKMGRMAGQYAKPRSSDMETIDGVTLPSYRGDAVNEFTFTNTAREPDPRRLIEMYTRSGTSLNLIRAFTRGGYADLRLVHQWNKGFTSNPAYKRYEELAAEIDRAVRFMAAAGAQFDAMSSVDFYSSHEALLMEYEAAMTREDSRTGCLYDTSAHFLWIGERTRDPEGAHVALLSQVANPVGVKIGPSTREDDLKALIDRLNPDGIAGRLTFITRMGADRIGDVLPGLIDAVRRDGRPVVWVCDPMHGNTTTSATGYKTRDFATIMREVHQFFDVHAAEGTVPGGIHVEMTGDDVTEVRGGADTIDDERLAERYETRVDPRLNHQQSLELAFQLAELLQAHPVAERHRSAMTEDLRVF